jgi:hypothetical protein
MIIILFFIFLKIFSVINEGTTDLANFSNNYRYISIINFYKNKSNSLNDEKLFLAFNDLKNKGISEYELSLIDWNDFVIIFLEYCLLYANKYRYINIIDSVKEKINQEDKIDLNKIFSELDAQDDSFFEFFYIQKIKLYINYKKNNKDCSGIIDSTYSFIFSYAREFFINF